MGRPPQLVPVCPEVRGQCGAAVSPAAQPMDLRVLRGSAAADARPCRSREWPPAGSARPPGRVLATMPGQLTADPGALPQSEDLFARRPAGQDGPLLDGARAGGPVPVSGPGAARVRVQPAGRYEAAVGPHKSHAPARLRRSAAAGDPHARQNGLRGAAAELVLLGPSDVPARSAAGPGGPAADLSGSGVCQAPVRGAL